MSIRIEQEGDNWLVIFTEEILNLKVDVVTVVLPRSIPLRDCEKRALEVMSMNSIRLRRIQKEGQEVEGQAQKSAAVEQTKETS